MSKLILLVDDDEIHNYIAEVSLKKVFPNCRVQVEADPAKALLFLESNVPDLILLDINMRGLNGFEFLDAYIEKSLDSDETKIVMLSTSFFDKDVNRANSYEVVSEYMVKPCQFESLRPYLSKQKNQATHALCRSCNTTFETIYYMNIESSSTIEGHLEHEKTLKRYFSKAIITACVLGFCVHFALIFFFFAFGVEEMAYFNIGSSIFFLIGYLTARKKLQFTQLIFVLASFEVLIHAAVATYYVGPESGFHMFSWVILPVMVLNSNFRLPLVLLGFVFIASLQLLFVFSDLFNPAVYVLDPWQLEISFQVSTFSVFFTLFLVIFYYRRIVQLKNAQMISEKESRIAANEELEKRANDMEDLVRTVAHDIKGSLNNISELSRLMESKNDLQENDKEMVGMIRTSSDSLKDFVVGVMNYSMSKESNIKKHRIQLNALTDELRHIFCQDNTVSIHLDTVMKTVNGDRRLLFRVLRNLIENGIKYNQSESPEISIEVAETEKEYKFEVLDNGIGIAREDHDRIFELFEIVGGKDRYGNEGTGFGLASTKNIVESLGGRLKCESVLGKGSVFSFTIAK